MQDIPRWIRDYIVKKSFSCGKCKMLLTEKHLTSIGVKFSYKNPTKEALYVELTCIKCGFVTKYEIRYMMLAEFSLDIIQELQEQQEEEDEEKAESREMRKMKKQEELDRLENKEDYDKVHDSSDIIEDEEFFIKAKKDKSKITLKEIRDSGKFLNKIKTHNEFLEAMGMSPEEIDKYKDFTE
jgi:RNase P subunit RPR2